MKFDINKVICISLKSHNEQQLKAISEVYRIDFKAMVEIKDIASKIWVESNGEYAIAYVDKNNGESVVCSRFCPITKKEKDALYKIQPIKTPKMPKAPRVDTKVEDVVEVSNVFIEDLISDFDVVLDTDTILEKITNKGMSSLTKAELDFLNNL